MSASGVVLAPLSASFDEWPALVSSRRHAAPAAGVESQREFNWTLADATVGRETLFLLAPSDTM